MLFSVLECIKKRVYMSKKKILKLSCLTFICVIVSAATGFVGSNLVIDNGRIAFKNTSFNVYIGEEAGLGDPTDTNLLLIEAHNVGIGRRSLWKNQSNSDLQHGTRNACVGGHCMYENVDGDRNSCVGTACLYGNVSGKMNFAGGYHAGAKHKTSYTVLIGAFAEEQNESAYMSVTLGAYAARYNQGKKNFFGGGSVASSALDINNSVFIGTATGNQQLTGDNNVIIGYNQNLEDINGSNQLNLAGVLRSSNVYTGHLRMRKEAGLELVNSLGDVYRLTVNDLGDLDVIIQP